jgi:hypothetical protein
MSEPYPRLNHTGAYLYFVAANGAEVWVYPASDGREPPVSLMLEVCEAAELGIERDLVEVA